jgi:hypothetical protein
MSEVLPHLNQRQLEESFEQQETRLSAMNETADVRPGLGRQSNTLASLLIAIKHLRRQATSLLGVLRTDNTILQTTKEVHCWSVFMRL